MSDCQRCGDELLNRRKGTRYCSRECSQAAWEARKLRPEAERFWAGVRSLRRKRPPSRPERES